MTLLVLLDKQMILLTQRHAVIFLCVYWARINQCSETLIAAAPAPAVLLPDQKDISNIDRCAKSAML